jgi:membrane protein YdbS with pleckstrin-like domain
VTDLFAAPQGTWQRVSPALATRDRLVAVLVAVPLLLIGVGLLVVPDLAVWVRAIGAVVLVAGAVELAAAWAVAGRQQARWGYRESDEELVITSGVLFRSLTVVPYGRLQYVDVEAGPLQRRLGIATITVHTASPRTAATLPGLPTDEAARLRDVLTARVRERGAGV